ncbi:MAG: trehalase family glycosidase [Verrucomicrobiota bacterium]
MNLTLKKNITTSAAHQRLLHYFCKHCSFVFREPNGFLKYPFIVPGGTYHHQLWDWDSFWLSRALLRSRRWFSTASNETIKKYVKGSWLNFFENQAPDGTVSILLQPDQRDVFGCSNLYGPETNQAKPVFGQMALDLMEAGEGSEWIKPWFPKLMLFYRHWLEKYGSPTGLLVWGSDLAIGVDNDPATYGRPDFSSANLLLNSLFYADLAATKKIAEKLGRKKESKELTQWMKQISGALQNHCWDPRDQFFYSVDIQSKDRRRDVVPADVPLGMDMTWNSLPLKIKSFTGLLPLWCKVATRRQADALVKTHFGKNSTLLAPYGIRSLSRDEKMYSPSINSCNPSNWLGPIWIVANFMVQEGLRQYGYDILANKISDATLRLLEKDLKKTGTLHECYHPDTGKPNFNKDFISWNVLALCMKPVSQQ